MIGDVAYPDLTTCGQRTEQHLVGKGVRSHQWADVVSSFGLNEWQTQAQKGLFRLKRLGKNWDGEGSLPPSTLAIDSTSELLVSIPFEDLPVPFVSPTSVGGVQLEWAQNGRELEIEILPDGLMEFLTVVNGDPQNEGPITREQVPSLARWLRDETDQGNQIGGIIGWVNSLTRT
jgi:hypothetical protein